MSDTPKCGMTIKGVPVETRQTMAAMAANDRTSIAELLVGMVRREKAARAGEAVEMPDGKPPASLGGIPAGTAPASMNPDAHLIELLATAATVPGLTRVAGLAGLLAARVRQARGLAPLPRRTPPPPRVAPPAKRIAAPRGVGKPNGEDRA